MIEEHVRTPFHAIVVGEEVEVQRFDQTPRGSVLEAQTMSLYSFANK
jgi:hypothetical protein